MIDPGRYEPTEPVTCSACGNGFYEYDEVASDHERGCPNREALIEKGAVRPDEDKQAQGIEDVWWTRCYEDLGHLAEEGVLRMETPRGSVELSTFSLGMDHHLEHTPSGPQPTRPSEIVIEFEQPFGEEIQRIFEDLKKQNSDFIIVGAMHLWSVERLTALEYSIGTSVNDGRRVDGEIRFDEVEPNGWRR